MVPAFASQQMHPLVDVFRRAAEDVKERWSAQIMDNDGCCDLDLGLDCGFALLNAIGEGLERLSSQFHKPHISSRGIRL